MTLSDILLLSESLRLHLSKRFLSVASLDAFVHLLPPPPPAPPPPPLLLGSVFQTGVFTGVNSQQLPHKSHAAEGVIEEHMPTCGSTDTGCIISVVCGFYPGGKNKNKKNADKEEVLCLF